MLGESALRILGEDSQASPRGGPKPSESARTRCSHQSCDYGGSAGLRVYYYVDARGATLQNTSGVEHILLTEARLNTR